MDQINYWTQMLQITTDKLLMLEAFKETKGFLTESEEITKKTLITQASMYVARLRTAVENMNEPKKKWYQRK